MGHIVISYPGENYRQQELLARHLRRLGHSVFVDVDVAGSVAWWEKVLEEIRSCDALVAIVSAAALNSVACNRERAYAFALGKPILPVAVEPLTQVLPRDLSLIDAVDYTRPGEGAASALAAALDSLPPAGELPSPLPPDPEPPLSYLSDLVDAVQSPGELTGEEQFQLLGRLEPALKSADPEERQGGLMILQGLASRPDLRADVEHQIIALQSSTVSYQASAFKASAFGRQ